MARNDGIDRTVARNQDLETPADVAKVQEHNEREKDSYSNQDIVPERTSLNVHFKAPTDDYVKMFEQMEQDGVISTRGLKPDAIKYGELVFDVNSAYFYNHGGYEFEMCIRDSSMSRHARRSCRSPAAFRARSAPGNSVFQMPAAPFLPVCRSRGCRHSSSYRRGQHLRLFPRHPRPSHKRAADCGCHGQLSDILPQG